MKRLQEFVVYHNEYPMDWVVPRDLDFIYNRYDLFSEDFYIFQCRYNDTDYYLTGIIQGNRLLIGLWLVHVEKDFFELFCKEVFFRMKHVQQIRYMHGLICCGVQSYEYNHFKIDLPETEEELHSRISSKHRYNLKRERSIIEKELGGGHYFPGISYLR